MYTKDGSTKLGEASNATVFMPVEIPRRVQKNNDVAICVKATWGNVDQRRLVEWFETQRLLGVSSIGVYTTPTTHPDTRQTLVQYGQTWLVEQRTLDYLERNVKSASNDGYFEMAHLVAINDCFYRHLYTHRFIAVIDFDEVYVNLTQTNSSHP